MRHAAKTDAADAEFAHKAARTSAQLTAIFVTRSEILGQILLLGLGDF